LPGAGAVSTLRRPEDAGRGSGSRRGGKRSGIPAIYATVDMASRTVLLLEDNESVRELIKVLLETEGYSIIEASDGQDGLAKAEQLHPDLMILDLMMPGVDGEKVLKTMRRHSKLRTVPILVVSGKYESLDALRSQIGDENIFPKPFEPTRMLDRIGELIGYPDDA
jgi:DNA-binding response OmpR family regulator